MTVHVVTGNLGAGKSLVCVGKIRDYLAKGRIVATNLNIVLSQLLTWDNKSARIVRVPDKPTLHDLLALGRGNFTKDESLNGLLVFDECGTWFNSRTWGDKDRDPMIKWLLHSRKLGWDILFIIQDVGIIDKQVRLTMAEHTVFCRRLDRMRIPFIGSFLSLLGLRIPLPRLHIGVVRYGTNDRALIVDNWIYRGDDLMGAYDTQQVFSDNYPHGSFSQLPPWHVNGWRRGKYTLGEYMRLTKIYWKRFKSPAAFLAGAALVAAGFFVSAPSSAVPSLPKVDLAKYEKAKIESFSKFPNLPPSFVLTLDNALISSASLAASGVTFSGTSSEITLTSGGRHAVVYR